MALEKIGVEAVIEGLSSFRSGIGGMEKDVSGFGRSVGGTIGPLKNMGDSLLKVGGIAAGAVVAGLAAATAGITAFAVGGIKAAIDMEDQMGTIAATMNTTKAEIQPLADLIIDLGVDPGLKVSAEEAASAIELLARNGLTMTEIIDGAAKSTVLLANATGAEFGNAADIATDAMSIFGIEASKMDSAVNSIVSVTTNSKFTIDDFSLAIRNGGAAAAMMNVSLDDFNTVIAATAEEMGSGMRAGTGFRNFLTRLTPSSDGAADAMKELGLVTSAGTNMFFDANGQLKSMAEVSGILQDALYGTSTAIVEVGGRTAAQNEELSRLQKIYSRTLTSINDYELGIKGAGLSEEARAKKLEDLNLQLSNTMAAMGPLNAIQGEFVESTKQLTDAERSAALELIFGQDALGTAIGLANEGEESFRALAGSMSETDAAAMALERMDSVAGVLEILGGVVDTVKLQIGQAFLPLVRDLADAFLSISEDVGPKIVLFFGEISTFISEFIRGLQATGDPISAFMEGLDNILPEATISEIWDFIDAVDEVISTVSEFVSTHAEAFKGAIAGIGAVLGSSVIVSVLGVIASVIATILSPIGLLIIGVSALGAAWQSNFGNIQGITFSIIGTIQELIAVFQEGGLLGVMMALTENWNLNWTMIQAVIMTAWEVIQGVIVSAIAIIQPAIQTFIDSASGAFSTFDTLVPGLALLWENIKPIILGVLAVIGAALLGLVGIVVGVVNGIASAIGPLIVTFGIVLNGVLTVVNGVIAQFGLMRDFIVALFGGTSTDISAAWDAMKNNSLVIIQGLVDIVVGLFEGLGITLVTLVSNTVMGIIQFFQNLYMTLVGGSIVPDMVRAIIQWFVNMKDQVISTITDFIAATITQITEFSQNFVAIFSNTKDKVIEKITELIDGAKEVISDSISGFIQLGSDIIDGVAKGIDIASGKIGQIVKQAVQNAISAAKRFLGIESPSKLMMEVIGTPMAEGIAVGIDQPNLLTSAFDNLFAQSIPMAQSVAAQPTVMAGGGTTINNRQFEANFNGDTNINNDTDIQAFRDFILRTVRDNI